MKMMTGEYGGVHVGDLLKILSCFFIDLLRVVEKAIIDCKSNRNLPSCTSFTRIKDMYTWPNVAARTEKVNIYVIRTYMHNIYVHTCIVYRSVSNNLYEIT